VDYIIVKRKQGAFNTQEKSQKTELQSLPFWNIFKLYYSINSRLFNIIYQINHIHKILI